MYLLFLDESGTAPNCPNPKKPYFTIGGAIIRAEDWQSIADKVQGFRTRHGLRGELKWRFFSPHNESTENPMLRKTPAERRELSAEYATMIAGSPLTIIACVTDVEAAFTYASVTNQRELYHFAYKPITERYQYFLQDAKGIGITIADHRGSSDDRMLRAHHDGLVAGRSRSASAYNRFVEGLLLQDSCHSVGIQIADFVTGAIHRAFSKGDARLATILKPKVRKNPSTGRVEGHGIVMHPRDRFRNELWRKV